MLVEAGSGGGGPIISKEQIAAKKKTIATNMYNLKQASTKMNQQAQEINEYMINIKESWVTTGGKETTTEASGTIKNIANLANEIEKYCKELQNTITYTETYKSESRETNKTA